MCFKFSGCAANILQQCQEIVETINLNLVQTFDNPWYAGTSGVSGAPLSPTNALNCTLPASCQELFGYPAPDGSFVIDLAISSSGSVVSCLQSRGGSLVTGWTVVALLLLL